jgi:TolB-like protein/tetratricopeptide (TPR) repeat protein
LQDTEHREASPTTSFWGRVSEHKVLQWSLAYLGAALALAHGQELVGHAFHWPELTNRIVIGTLTVGFPIAIALAWYHGHKRLTRISAGEMLVVALLLIIGAALLVAFVRIPEPETRSMVSATVPGTPASRLNPTGLFAPPPHSVAVLPFVNMSGDAHQEYFSDGLSEELLNALSRIDELQVAARTSSFSFKGQNVDVTTIARKLNVGTVLEGSVRRSGDTVRVTAQLVDAVSGYHRWSQSYDRSLKDILAVQTEVATAVAQQLLPKLVGSEGRKIELGGTRDPEAYDAYLRGLRLFYDVDRESATRAALAAFDEATALDAGFAMAFVRKVQAALSVEPDRSSHRDFGAEAAAAAEQAIALAPNLGEAHVALAMVREAQFDFQSAASEYARALALAPGSALVQRLFATFASRVGEHDAAIRAARRALELDPENFWTREAVGAVLLEAGHFAEAIVELRKAEAMGHPMMAYASSEIGFAYLLMNQPERARQQCAASLQKHEADKTDASYQLHRCLAIAYHALGQPDKAAAEFTRFRTLTGDSKPLRNASIYASWGDRAAALHWLRAAEQARDPELIGLRAMPTLDPVRNDPEFRALERRLNFPPLP